MFSDIGKLFKAKITKTTNPTKTINPTITAKIMIENLDISKTLTVTLLTLIAFLRCQAEALEALIIIID